MKQKIVEATKYILEDNLQILEYPYSEQKIIVVYDTDCELTQIIASGYIENLKNNPQAEIINFNGADTELLKEKLMSLEPHSTVILVQSTNFRLDDFRLRLNLHNQGVGCLEHNHLFYIKEDEIENYVDAISHQTPEYERLGRYLESEFALSDTLVIKTSGGGSLDISGGFEDLKQNTGNYSIMKNRGSTFPIGEVFTEALDFSKVNGEFTIYAFPDETFQMHFVEPFTVKVENSILTCSDENCPQKFRELLEKIAVGEDNEVFVRELGFGLNKGISRSKPLSDVNAFERIAGFHMSLGKKHNIYRKKIHKDITQRYHIDIFPDVEQIVLNGKIIFENEKYII